MAEAPTTNGKTPYFREIGGTGLNLYTGYTLQEDFQRELQGINGIKIYEEMGCTPIVGAILFVIEQMVAQIEWKIEPGSDQPADKEPADFIQGCLFDDMNQSFTDTLSEICTFFQYGWAWLEVVYKMRKGRDVPNSQAKSKFTDNKIGWRKWGLRGQNTLDGWEVDDSGGIVAMLQRLPTNPGQQLRIPIEKSLLFRTRVERNNPEGKALDPETPIPTPNGWRRLDDLQIGDKVFDETGRIRYVTARADWEDRPCYEVRFDGGHRIVADANHEWLTQSIDERVCSSRAKIRTTEQLAQRVKAHRGKVSNFSVPWAGALDYPEQTLPLDPYFLGLWLGDGDTNGARISCHADDCDETAELLVACGYRVAILPNGPIEGKGRAIRVLGDKNWSNDGPQAMLTVMGLRGNKHIPEAYLKGSITQRMALLSGLMDSDGTVDKDGRCEFINTNKELAEAVAELVRSLGVGALFGVRKHATELRSDAWAVRFTPDFQPFRLSRKAAKCRIERARKNHYITEIIPTSPRRTVCIEVDSPSHLYLAGHRMVPTHNSLLRNAYRPWFYGKRIEEIQAIGVERDLAGLPVLTPPDGVDLWNSNDPIAASSKHDAEVMIKSIRRGEREGVLKPFGWTLELLASGSRRNFDTSTIIKDYNVQIAQSCLADFIFLGQGKTGSWALSSDKTDMFVLALGAYLRRIKDVVNRHAIPTLLEANGMDFEDPPHLEHGDIETQNLQELAAYITALTTAGAISFPDLELERHLRTVADLPPMGEEQEQAEQDYIDAGGLDKPMPGETPPAPQPNGQDGQVMTKREAWKKLNELRETMKAQRNGGHP